MKYNGIFMFFTFQFSELLNLTELKKSVIIRNSKLYAQQCYLKIESKFFQWLLLAHELLYNSYNRQL